MIKKVAVEMEKLNNLNSGLGQFCLNLGNSLQKQSFPDLDICYYLPKNRAGIFGNSSKYEIISRINKILPVQVSNTKVWHCTHQQSGILPYSKKVRIVLTIHDLNFLEKYKRGWKKRARLKKLQRLVNRAAVITAISGYTKRIAEENLDLKGKSIKVIYNGNSLQVVKDAELPGWLPEGPFIFSIGIINPKKNFHVLVSLLKNLPDRKLVIAGNKEHSYAGQIMTMAKQAGVEQRIFLPGVIDDATRYYLYENCESFAFPSLSEGFGLPVIEAMSLGKPVFLSELTSLTEVGGPEAYYWKSFDPGHMAEIYKKGMKNFKEDSDKVAKIKKWAEKFTWDEAAKRYLEIYRSI